MSERSHSAARAGDLPRPPRLSYAENRRRSAEGVRRYWTKERQVRGARRAADIAAAAAEIGSVTDREILITGAIAYWCEGTKRKPHQNFERVVFVNSDAGLIRFFLCFLTTAGVRWSDVRFCVHIHESADVEAAQRFWREVTGASADQFTKPARDKRLFVAAGLVRHRTHSARSRRRI